MTVANENKVQSTSINEAYSSIPILSSYSFNMNIQNYYREFHQILLHVVREDDKSQNFQSVLEQKFWILILINNLKVGAIISGKCVLL